MVYLSFEGLFVIGVDVTVADGVYEFARFEASDVRDHQGQQCVAGDIEGHSQTLWKCVLFYQKHRRTAYIKEGGLAVRPLVCHESAQVQIAGSSRPPFPETQRPNYPRDVIGTKHHAWWHAKALLR